MNREAESILISEAGLSTHQARVYLLVVDSGRMDAAHIAAALDISEGMARQAASSLVLLGGFIEYTDTLYESMHPRFSVVNMYRRHCERSGIPFGRNKDIDNLGAALEPSYDAARTK